MRSSTFLTAVAALGSLVGLAPGQPTIPGGVRSWTSYQVTDLGVLTPGGFSVAESINASGVAAGVGTAESHYRAALFENGSATQLRPVGGDDSEGYGINDAGQVVGETEINQLYLGQNITRAFLWLPTPAYGLLAGMHDLGTLGGPYSIANEINNAGQVVGGASALLPGGATPWRAFIWQNGTMSSLGTLGGDASEALAVNNLGRVAGKSQPTGSQSYHAFFWRSGYGMADLGTLGGAQSFGHDLNDADVVVGYSELSEVTGTIDLPIRRAFVWLNGQMTALPTLPIGPPPGGAYGPDNIHTIANGVNNAGVIVGESFPNGGACVWRSGVIRDLNDLIPAGSGWWLSKAKAINDAGQIVGIGYHNGLTRAFLLTPAPPVARSAAWD